jgi:hypothetical protein
MIKPAIRNTYLLNLGTPNTHQRKLHLALQDMKKYKKSGPDRKVPSQCTTTGTKPPPRSHWQSYFRISLAERSKLERLPHNVSVIAVSTATQPPCLEYPSEFEEKSGAEELSSNPPFPDPATPTCLWICHLYHDPKDVQEIS